MYVSVWCRCAIDCNRGYGIESLAGSSRSAFRRSIPASVQKNAQRDPTAVTGGLLHIPSIVESTDCAPAGEAIHALASTTRTAAALLDFISLRFSSGHRCGETRCA